MASVPSSEVEAGLRPRHLRTGKDVVVANGNCEPRQNAELDAAGLLGARDRHNVVLVPFKRTRGRVVESGSMHVSAGIGSLPLKEPFVIARDTTTEAEGRLGRDRA